MYGPPVYKVLQTPREADNSNTAIAGSTAWRECPAPPRHSMGVSQLILTVTLQGRKTEAEEQGTDWI